MNLLIIKKNLILTTLQLIVVYIAKFSNTNNYSFPFFKNNNKK